MPENGLASGGAPSFHQRHFGYAILVLKDIVPEMVSVPY